MFPYPVHMGGLAPLLFAPRPLLFAAAFILSVLCLFAAPARANCFVAGANERMTNACLFQQLRAGRLPRELIPTLDYRLKREGNARGLGLPGRVRPLTVNRFVSPILSYSTDVNGGNSDKPIYILGLPFTFDDIKKKDILVGIAPGISGRRIWGLGRYIDFGGSVSYAWSPRHRLAVKGLNLNACSKNHLDDLWFLDACATRNNSYKQLKTDKSDTLSLTVSKLASLGGGAWIQPGASLTRSFGSFEQNQLGLSVKMLSRKGLYSSVSLNLGESVPGQLATKYSANASFTFLFRERPMTVALSYASAEGGSIFGIPRDENTMSLNISYPLTERFTISGGYRAVKSTIDHFDLEEPLIGISFTPIRF